MNVSATDGDLMLPSGRVRTRRWGPDGAPVLLCVHGLAGNVAAFGFLAERLAGPGRQVLAFDLRGCGRSEVTPSGSYGMDRHADDVLAIADELGLPEIDVAGWSLGALVVMAVARREPSRLRSVALIDHAGPAQSRALAGIRAWLDRLELVVDTPEEYLLEMRGAGYVDRWSPFWDAFYRYELEGGVDGRYRPSTSHAVALENLDQPWPRDWSDHWRALTMPALLVRAGRPINDGLFVPERAVIALGEVNPAVQVVDAPGSDHFTVMEDPLTADAMAGVLA